LLVCFWFFFFQAEDGIRVFHVTGVQTCALPISPVGARSALRTREFWLLSVGHGNALAIVGAVSVHFVIYVGETIGLGVTTAAARSEERRVGKARWSRWPPHQEYQRPERTTLSLT